MVGANINAVTCLQCIALLMFPGTTRQYIKAALSKFSVKTAMSTDQIPPKALLQVSGQGLDALARLLMRIEAAGHWPSGLITLMAVLPKPTGGDRLIGILPVICRVWGRVRYPITAQWLHNHRHECFWACKGRSSSDAAFAHDLETELQTSVGGTLPQFDLAP